MTKKEKISLEKLRAKYPESIENGYRTYGPLSPAVARRFVGLLDKEQEDSNTF